MTFGKHKSRRAWILRSAVLILFSGTVSLLQAQTLQTGPQVLTFFSDLDDTEQPYSIYIPAQYDATKEYPLVIMLHGAGSNHRLAMRRVFGKSNFGDETDVEASRYFPPWKDVDVIVAAPYARGTADYQGFVEKDVFDMLADVQQRFSIDENRIYLTGLSMGGGGTLWIGLGHPDIWAAIAPVCPAPPKGTEALAPNALNMAVRFIHGQADPVVPVSVSRDWVANLKSLNTRVVDYEEYEGVGHDSWVRAYIGERIFDWLLQFERNPHPEHVRLAAHDLAHGKSYWVRFDMKTPGTVAFMDAHFHDKNNLAIRTQHLQAFTLSLDGHPMYSLDEVLMVTVDETSFEISPGQKEVSCSKTSGGLWTTESLPSLPLQKQAGLEGPIANAFASRHVYVYGTADDPTPEALQTRMDMALKAANWSVDRGWFLGRIKFYPRVVADRDLRKSDFESSNLILFGTAETNRVIAEYAEDLPLRLNQKAVDEYGLVFIFPNKYQHYIVVNSGLPWWAMPNNTEWSYYPDVQTPLRNSPDFILFRKSNNTPAVEGYFTNDWKMPAEKLRKMRESHAVK